MDYVTISSSKVGRREIHFFTNQLDNCEKVRIEDTGQELIVTKQYMIVHKQSINLARAKNKNYLRITFMCDVPFGKYYFDEKKSNEDVIVIPYKHPIIHSKDE